MDELSHLARAPHRTCINLASFLSVAFLPADLDANWKSIWTNGHLAQALRGFIERTLRVKHVENSRSRIPRTRVPLYSTRFLSVFQVPKVHAFFCSRAQYDSLGREFRISLHRHVVSRRFESFHLQDRPSLFDMKILSLVLRADAQLFVLLSRGGNSSSPGSVYIYERTARVRYRSLISLPRFIHSRLLIKPPKCASHLRDESFNWN